VYFLASARLGFRPWRDADLSLATDLWSDTEVTRWIGGPLSPAAAAERLAAEIATHAEAGIQYWPIFQLADAAHVEGSTAKAPNAFDREAAKIAKTRAREKNKGIRVSQRATRPVVSWRKGDGNAKRTRSASLRVLGVFAVNLPSVWRFGGSNRASPTRGGFRSRRAA